MKKQSNKSKWWTYLVDFALIEFDFTLPALAEEPFCVRFSRAFSSFHITLNFRKFKVALNPLRIIFFKFAKSNLYLNMLNTTVQIITK